MPLKYQKTPDGQLRRQGLDVPSCRYQSLDGLIGVWLQVVDWVERSLTEEDIHQQLSSKSS